MPDHDDLRKALNELDQELAAPKGMLGVAYATNNVKLQDQVILRVWQISEIIKQHSETLKHLMTDSW